MIGSFNHSRNLRDFLFLIVILILILIRATNRRPHALWQFLNLSEGTKIKITSKIKIKIKTSVYRMREWLNEVTLRFDTLLARDA